MLTYVTDICWHALVIPCFKIVVILGITRVLLL